MRLGGINLRLLQAKPHDRALILQTIGESLPKLPAKR